MYCASGQFVCAQSYQIKIKDSIIQMTISMAWNATQMHTTIII